jgi:hypothetical protein
MTGALRAGLAYGALAFLFGLVLGPLRELWLAPWIGGFRAAALEAVVMAVALWWAAGRILPAAPRFPARAAVAVLALVVVVLGEAVVGVLLEATGLAAGRAPRTAAEQALGLPLLLWMVALPFLRRRGAEDGAGRA